jgi:hypothetical protein
MVTVDAAWTRPVGIPTAAIKRLNTVKIEKIRSFSWCFIMSSIIDRKKG